MHSKIAVAFVLALTVSFASAKCPLPVSIFPCVCNNLLSTISCAYATNLTALKVKLSGKLEKDFTLAINFLNQKVIDNSTVAGQRIRGVAIAQSTVERIEENAFADFGDSLLELEIGTSKLQSIPVSALSGLRNLQRLSIRRANVTSVLKSEIDQLPHSIRAIRLDFNAIENIERGAFTNLDQLRLLSLSYSMLSTVPDIWIPLHLSSLDLSASNFVSVPIKSLKSLEALSVNMQNNKVTSIPEEDDLEPFLRGGSSLDLRINPLQCTCSLKWIVEFMAASKKHGLKGVCQGDTHRQLLNIEWLQSTSFKDC